MRGLDLIKRLYSFKAIFYLFNGIGNIYLKKNQLAINSLKDGLLLIVDNNLLKAEFYAYLGDAYHGINNHVFSDESYENCLKITPNNSTVLNNYSYYLSVREENLLLAKEMIIRCIELTINDPNPSIIDTYAWILYKCKERSIN